MWVELGKQEYLNRLSIVSYWEVKGIGVATGGAEHAALPDDGSNALSIAVANKKKKKYFFQQLSDYPLEGAKHNTTSHGSRNVQLNRK